MDTRWIKLCFLLIVCAEYFEQAKSATLQGSVDPNPVIKNKQHTIKCDFTLDATETLLSLSLYLGTSATEQNKIALSAGSSAIIWSSSVPENLNRRGYLQGSSDEGHLNLGINSTECSDKDRTYLCVLEYIVNGESQSNSTKAQIPTLSGLQVVAAPVVPSDMTSVPAEETVMEHTNMTFECRGNVGRPAGTFKWFKFIGTGSEAGQEVTSQAVIENEILSGDGCTYTRASRLTLNLTRTEVNEKLVVRCQVDQQLVGQDVTGCTEANFCRLSPEIDVQYPVTVSVASDTVTVVQGRDQTLECNAVGNPQPSVLWQRDGENTTTSGNTLTLSQVSMDDSGVYVCTAFNTINGVQLNDSATVHVIVEETTTPPPTTMTVTTTTVSTTNDVQTDTAGSDDTTIIIIVVVVVLVVVIIAIVAVVIVLRRRRKGKAVEEPPEKPFNNNAGINTVAARPPDLVSNSYDNGPPYKNEDGLGYAELQFDNKPRSRRPLAIDDSHTDYSDVSMPQV